MKTVCLHFQKNEFTLLFKNGRSLFTYIWKLSAVCLYIGATYVSWTCATCLYRSISFCKSDICRSISSKIELFSGVSLLPGSELDRIDPDDCTESGTSLDKKLKSWSRSTWSALDWVSLSLGLSCSAECGTCKKAWCGPKSYSLNRNIAIVPCFKCPKCSKTFGSNLMLKNISCRVLVDENELSIINYD